MKKDKEIWLDPEEIQQLLEGGLYWSDIEPKLSPENVDSFKRHLSIDPEKDPEKDLEKDLEKGLERNPGELYKSREKKLEPDEEKNVRAILLGEEEIPNGVIELDRNESNPKVFDPIIKDRQIDFSRVEEKVQRPFMPVAATTEEPDSDWQRDKIFKEAKFSNEEINKEVDNEFKEIILSSEIEPEEEPTPFGGLKLILLLAVVAVLTFGFWFYFLNR